jgi:hypothetical protein
MVKLQITNYKLQTIPKQQFQKLKTVCSFEFRYLVLFVIWSLLFGTSSAQTGYLRDVPQGHYAYDSVYDLIKQGITGGFPDGTYRGKSLMTRYELAAFMDKFVRSRALADGANEKLVAEIKSEVSLVKYAAAKENKETKCSIDFAGRWQRGETPARSGQRSAYRLKLGLEKNFDEVVDFKVDLDTLDSGFNGASRDLVRDLLGFGGKINWGRSALEITAGPGEILHVDNGLFPAENNTFFRRPWPGLSFSSAIGKAEVALALVSRSTDPTGKISTSEISAGLTLNWPAVKLTARPRCFYDQSGSRDIRLELGGAFKPSPLFNCGLLVGLARTAAWPHGLYVRGDVALAETLTLTVQRLGSQYRERAGYNIFDIFDRNIADGSTSTGLTLRQPLGLDWFVLAQGDYSTPLNLATTSFHLGRNFGAGAVGELIYQTYDTARSLGLQASLQL